MRKNVYETIITREPAADERSPEIPERHPDFMPEPVQVVAREATSIVPFRPSSKQNRPRKRAISFVGNLVVQKCEIVNDMEEEKLSHSHDFIDVNENVTQP